MKNFGSAKAPIACSKAVRDSVVVSSLFIDAPY